MKLEVSKKRLLGTALLLISSLLLVLVHADLFLENGQLCGTELPVIIFCLFAGCYIKSAYIRLPIGLNRIWMAASFLLLPYLMVYVVEDLAGQSASVLDTNRFWLNYFWCLVVYVLLFALTSHYRFSIIGGTVFYYGVAVVNHFLLLFRNSPLQLADILSVGTALDVASHYTLMLDLVLLRTGAALFLAVCVATMAEFHFQREQWRTAIGSVTLLAFLVCSVGYFYQDSFWERQEIDMNFWKPLHFAAEYGTTLALAMNGKFMWPERPKQYSVAHAEKVVQSSIEAQHKAGKAAAGNTAKATTALSTRTMADVPAQQQKPNIIAIMNESYADLGVLGQFDTNLPYLPYFYILQDNTIRGNLYSSVVGGGTCDCEFEFLTGMTTAFMPPGSRVYQQFITKPLDSLATTLEAQGYDTVAFHPGKPTSWRRDKVYPYLGFDKFLTTEDMDNPEYLRDTFVSDASNYDMVIKLFEEKEDAPLFLFNVTIQNHGSYRLGTGGISEWISVQGMNQKYSEAGEYLSVLRISDQALKDFMQYFEQVEEPTIILFFGDHQPAVEEEFVEELLGKPINQFNLAELQKRYQVPFFLWANYDIAERDCGNLSMNYLSTLLLQTAGLQLPQYNQYLAALQQQVPMINTQGYMDKNGQHHEFWAETEEAKWIEDYKVVQYNNMFGGHGRLEELYK